jgi:hypothetical protein
MGWISVRNWRKFQHYDPTKRQPPWIKNYTELTKSDEYLGLGAGERAVLHGIWLEYASSQCALRFDPVLLARRLNLRVRQQHLDSLIHAGFISNVASKTLAEGYHDASALLAPRAHAEETETEEETEPEKETPSVHPVSSYVQNGRTDGLADDDIDFGSIPLPTLKDIA